MSGWIKMHRQIMDSDLWNDVVAFRLFTYLLMMAAHQDGVKINGIELKRGQYIRSYRNLAKDLSYIEKRGVKQHSISTIKRNVEKLVDSGRVNTIETDYGTLFTIVNYDKYQGSGDVPDDKQNAQKEFYGTTSERQRNAIGTTSEQEQELKNLRMQEESTTTTPADPFLEVHRAFEARLCRLSAFQVQSLEHWFEDFGRNVEVLLEAIKIADDKNKRSFAFVEYLLKEWANNKLTNVEQVRSHERNKFSNVHKFEPKPKPQVDHQYDYGF